MPASPRPNGKVTKIAYAILGTPINMPKGKYKKKKSIIEEKLVFDETSRVR